MKNQKKQKMFMSVMALILAALMLLPIVSMIFTAR